MISKIVNFVREPFRAFWEMLAEFVDSDIQYPIYELSYTWWEDYSPFLFSAPVLLTQGEWEAICQDLVDEAVDVLLATKETYPDGTPRRTWIGWLNIVEEIVKLLEAREFVRIRPVEMTFYGSNIIEDEDDIKKDHYNLDSPGQMSEESLKKVAAYNKALRDDLHQHRFGNGETQNDEQEENS